MFFSSFWYIICRIWSSESYRNSGLILRIQVFLSVLEFCRKSLNFGRIFILLNLGDGGIYGWIEEEKRNRFICMLTVEKAWEARRVLEENRRRRDFLWLFRRTSTVSGDSECMYKFLAVVRMYLELWVEFWALKMDFRHKSGEFVGGRRKISVRYLSFWEWWSWGTVVSKFAFQPLKLLKVTL